MVHKKSGFTLLEILLVVAAIAILAGIVILALNPGKQLGDTRNAERRSDVSTILNATWQYAIDNDGALPTGVATDTASVIGTAGAGCDTICGATTTAAACLDLSGDLVSEYLVGIPVDPTSGTDAITDYYIRQTQGGRVMVGACDPEQGETMEVAR